MDERLKNAAANVAVILIISLILIVGNTGYRQYSQLKKGMQGEEAGNFPAAVAGYESAIRMYIPFSPGVETAAKRLWQMAETLEGRGDLRRALVAYRSLRSAFYATKWLAQPGQGWITRSEERIDAILRRQKGA